MAKKIDTATQTAGTPIVVTTAHRGVFFGYAQGDYSGKVVTIQQARNANYWKCSTGFLQLGGVGPEKGSRISDPVPELTLQDVTSAFPCTEVAAQAWETVGWTR